MQQAAVENLLHKQCKSRDDSVAVTRTERSACSGSLLIIKMAVLGVAAILWLQRLLGVRILSQDLSPELRNQFTV